MKNKNTMMKQTLLIILFLATLTAFSFANLSDSNYLNSPLKLKTQSALIDDTVNLNLKITTDTLITVDDSFTVDNFKAYLAQINAPHAHVIYSIAKHESGFRSALFLNNNNLFGMMRPNTRPNKSIQEGQRWAKFEHWTHSVDDFILYMQYTGMADATEKRFLNHIDRNYAMRIGYGERLKKYYPEYLN